MEQNKYLIWLSAIWDLNDRHRRALCAYFNSARALYENAKRSDLVHVLENVSAHAQKLADAILQARKSKSPDGVLEELMRIGCTAYAYGDDGYPALLRKLGDDAPLLLYAKGDYTPDQEKAIAVVGTRRNSRYGAGAAHALSRDLASAGVCVVSGMADGIDAHAHRGAMEANGVTVAVLGCGVDVIYPRANRDLYQRICHSGVVISEYYPGMKPLAHHFPQRNRIICGMCQGVVVVECPEKSGAMITARLSIDQGRELFVVPGNITSPQAKGSNSLLMSGASPILDATDILNRFGWGPTFTQQAGGSQTPPDLSELDRTVYNALLPGSLHLEQLAKACNESVEALLGHLTLMEIRGIIKQLPGQLFALADR